MSDDEDDNDDSENIYSFTFWLISFVANYKHNIRTRRQQRIRKGAKPGKQNNYTYFTWNTKLNEQTGENIHDYKLHRNIW